MFIISLDFFGPSTLEIIAAGFDDSCGGVANELDSMKEVFVGGSISGMVCYAVTPADAEAGILVSVDNIEGGRVFLATTAGQGTSGPAPTAVSPEPPATPPAAEAGAIGTRETPFAVASPAVITLETFGDADGSTWALTVDAAGSDITQAVLEENQFNEPPADGKLFYGVPVTLTLQGATKEPLSPLFNISLDFFGPSTLEIIAAGFDGSCGVVANELDSMKEVFVGGSISGMVCYAVTPADAEAGILLSVDSIEGGRVFLATR